MTRSAIQILIDDEALAEVDRLVREGIYPDRNQAVEEALTERFQAMRKRRLARESEKLDRDEEVRLAEESFVGEVEWPEY